MWPWEHIAVAYLTYSLGSRLVGRRPAATAAAAVAVGALFPDLVDKPLSWVFGVLPGGRSLAHSLLVAVPVVLLVGLVARDRRAGALGVAFSVGYLSHLPLDVLASGVFGGEFDTGFLLWPLTPTATRQPDSPAFVHLLEQHREFLAFLTSPVGRRYLAFELLLLLLASLVWWLDGAPGLGWLRRRAGGLRRLVHGS
ncbi:metal-dependent hydrolase [Haloarchaeobius litoreus]|uniref:Metal-dependent hydrolase n=1 Tax=Haloarchaeobius litoreus TaxID=755306 RepID=A0ABD6DRM9_9EURY|nr:metal-dependent hydrolase [Haloarchaeobius litoreus]